MEISILFEISDFEIYHSYSRFGLEFIVLKFEKSMEFWICDLVTFRSEITDSRQFFTETFC